MMLYHTHQASDWLGENYVSHNVITIDTSI